VEVDRNNLTVGTDARLMCRVRDSLRGQGVVVEWKKDGEMIDKDNEEDRFTFDGRYLNIEKVIGQDAGEYVCMAVRGDEEVMSSPVTLNIEREYRNYVRMGYSCNIGHVAVGV